MADSEKLQRNGSNDNSSISVEHGSLSDLETMVGRKMWPSPTAHNAKETNAPSKSEIGRPRQVYNGEPAREFVPLQDRE